MSINRWGLSHHQAWRLLTHGPPNNRYRTIAPVSSDERPGSLAAKAIVEAENDMVENSSEVIENSTGKIDPQESVVLRD